MLSIRNNVLLVIVATVCAVSAVWANAPETDANGDLPMIYVDCRSCDQDYFRSEILMADFVRDRQLADVHILFNRERTGSGGVQFIMEFIGRNRFDGLRDTLIRSFTDSDTDDTIREGLAETIRLGLVRYLARTSQADNLSLSYSRPSASTEVTDKWNYWVFSIDMNTWLNGQKSMRSINMYGNVNARRVTEDLKLSFGVWGNYNENKFDYNDVQTLSLTRSKGGNARAYFAIDDHWSWGPSSSIWSSTFSNRSSQWSGSLGVEYNLFPYSEYTRRQLRFKTTANLSYVDYLEETIYSKKTEWLGQQSMSVALELVQPWGTIDGSLSGSYYLHDIDLYSVNLDGNLSLRLIEGLSLTMDGNISRVRDQLNLPRGGASEEEVLLRQKELATNYRYWTSFGFRYTFGSRYNNVVNPRFGN